LEEQSNGKLLQKCLTNKGYRLTRPRELILELLCTDAPHADANLIYDQVRKQLPHVSLGTVYRTLHVLAEAGLIRELHCGDGQAHYDGNVTEHYHVMCTCCGTVEDVPISRLDALEQQAETLTRFAVAYHRLDFYGLCARCQERESGQA
jgi:Fur family peroxide stress response transcriptional regulator